MLTNGKRRCATDASDVVNSRVCPTRCAATCCRAAESGTTDSAFCTKAPHDTNASHIPTCVWVCARERDDTKNVAINALAVAVGLIKRRSVCVFVLVCVHVCAARYAESMCHKCNLTVIIAIKLATTVRHQSVTVLQKTCAD